MKLLARSFYALGHNKKKEVKFVYKFYGLFTPNQTKKNNPYLEKISF